ncbi:MAG: RecX family transcriptional regulator [Bacteroides sp.]|nr:RecX family transcriptional regulator [Bacteroides sp.]
MKTITETEALQRAASYCSAAEHCRTEVFDKLQKWSIPYDGIERILTYLEREGYLDEERYCRAFVKDKYRFDKWGRRKIAQALHLKKIASACVDKCLREIDQEEYQQGLRKLLEAKRRSIRAGDDYQRNAKLIRFALGRGFEMNEIRACLPGLEEELYPD